MSSHEWISFVNCYRNDPVNQGKTMNTCMQEARKLWKDPVVKSDFIRALGGEFEKDDIPSERSGNESKSVSEKKEKAVSKKVKYEGKPAKRYRTKKDVVESDSEEEVPVKKVVRKSRAKVVKEEEVDEREELKNYYKQKYKLKYKNSA